MTDKINTVVIHSKKMCQYLMVRGFILIGVENNLKGRNKIFLFVDSPSLRQVMSEFNTDKEFHNFLSSMQSRR